MDVEDIQKYSEAIDAAAIGFLGLLGPKFTNTAERHIETDIAAAACIAGLMILRQTGVFLDKFTPGTLILSDIDSDLGEMEKFLMSAASKMGLDPSGGWDSIVPEEDEPIYSLPEMTHMLEKGFYSLCLRHGIKKELYRFVAALAAVKIVFEGHKTKTLDQNIGKGLVMYYVVAGAKTVPYPLEKD